MNESEFEKELRTLRPVAPSAALAEKIDRELRGETRAIDGALVPVAAKPVVRVATAAIVPRPRRAPGAWLRGLAWVCGGAAAVLAVVVFVRSPELTSKSAPVAVSTTAQFEAGESTNELINAEDEGLLYDEDQTPQRQLRLTYIERHTWTNPATGAVIEFEIPREDIVLMPVAMQ